MITWNKSFNKISEIYKSLIQIIYDIVKAHGGELNLPVGRQGKEGEGAEIIIELPYNLKTLYYRYI